jgi:hypothetical protein
MRGSKPSINVLVRDEFTKQSEGSFSLEEPLVLSFHRGRNLHNDLKKINEALKSSLHPLILDLYNIALVVYVWDLQTVRPEPQPRDFRVLMSVSNKDKWDDVKSHLEATLRFLTGDTFTFHFVQGKPTDAAFQFQKKSDEVVALFSGGLDSLAGVKWMLDQKLKPTLVSHPGMGLISRAQKDLIELLMQMNKDRLTWHQIRATAEPGSGLAEKEYSQLSRSFLYLTLGVIFALGLGIEKEFIPENGVLAFNIPLTQSRIHMNTRTAHPRFLGMYQQLLDSIFGHHVEIVNPFLDKTKGQVVKLLDAEGFRDLVKTTISCPNPTPLRYRGLSTSRVRHCGVCFPCIVRRIAIHHGNLWNDDAVYARNITGTYSRIPEEARKLLLEMTDFSRQIEHCTSLDDLSMEFPQFFMGDDADPAMLFEMTKRHVAEFKEFVEQRCHSTLRQSLGLA